MWNLSRFFNMKLCVYEFVFGLTILISYVSADNPCAPRSYDVNKIVCVCNSTYCDTIDNPAKLPAGQFIQYTSSQAGLRFKKKIGGFGQIPKGWIWLFNSAPYYGAHMKVYRDTKYQSIIGFGAAMSDSAGINIMALSPPTQDKLLRSLFSPEGIEYNIVRVPIGGADYSTHTYTLDESPGDTDLIHFRLATEDILYKIPLLKRAQAMSAKPIKLKAAAWTAPPWMKTNNNYNGLGLLKNEYYQTWANYHMKFLDEYKKAGLEFWTISTGNEPSSGLLIVSPNLIPSTGWVPKNQMKWLRENLGPTLQSSQHNRTKILVLDDQRLQLPWWLDDLKNDLDGLQYVIGISIHWYSDFVAPVALLDKTHENFPGLFMLQTEASAGLNPWNPNIDHVDLGSWSRGEEYMKSIIEYLSHWTSGWMDWNIALNRKGGPNFLPTGAVDGSIIVNEINDEFYKQPMFYALGHFSKFVPEGSVRIGITPQATGGLESIAFQTPDNATVIILWNKWDVVIPLTINDPGRGVANLNIEARSFNSVTYW